MPKKKTLAALRKQNKELERRIKKETLKHYPGDKPIKRKKRVGTPGVAEVAGTVKYTRPRSRSSKIKQPEFKTIRKRPKRRI